MARDRRKFGTTVRRIIEPRTGEVLGWVHRWNTGEETTLSAVELPLGAVDGDEATDEGRGEEPGEP